MSKYFQKDRPIIGLDISATSVKIMSVDTKKWTVLGYGSVDVDPQKLETSLDSDGVYITEELTKLLTQKTLGTLNSNHVVMGIPTSRTYSRSVTVKTSPEQTLEDSIRLEAEQYVPIPLGQLYIDYEVTDKTKDSTTALMCAVPQKIVDNCVSAATKAGLEVLAVEPGMLSVARILRYTEGGSLPTVVIDIGAASTDIAIIDGTIKVTGGIPVGGNTFTLSIADKLKISLEKSHQLKVLNGLSPGPKQKPISTALDPDLKRIVQEIKKIVRYYTERVEGARKLEQVIIVGGGSNLPGIGEYFTDNLVIAARVASPWQLLNFAKLPQPARQFKPRYLTVAGLASVKQEEIWQ
ncbi:MAG: type IV pilus assembly protein PilM [Acidobacteriota bacterium]